MLKRKVPAEVSREMAVWVLGVNFLFFEWFPFAFLEISIIVEFRVLMALTVGDC